MGSLVFYKLLGKSGLCCVPENGEKQTLGSAQEDNILPSFLA